jgi:hypothetical protein
VNRNEDRSAAEEIQIIDEKQPKIPEFEKVHDFEQSYEEGTLVQLHVVGSNGGKAEQQRDDQPVYGLVKWIGYLPMTSGDKMAGIELEEELSGATNGWHNGSQIFACPDRKAVFVPLTHFTTGKDKIRVRNIQIFFRIFFLKSIQCLNIF